MLGSVVLDAGSKFCISDCNRIARCDKHLNP